MTKKLQICSALVVISVGVVVLFCAVQEVSRFDPEEETLLRSPSIVETFRRASVNSSNDHQEIVSPLVSQARAFALYLNPPRTRQEAAASIPAAPIQTVGSAAHSPKFRLVATSYHRSRPKESMALVSEPGSGSRWVKQGVYLGHFVVEKVKRGMMIYRDGDRLREMVLDMKVPIHITQAHQTTLASDLSAKQATLASDLSAKQATLASGLSAKQATLVKGRTITSPSRSSSSGKSSTKIHRPLHGLGPARPKTRPMANDNEIKDKG